MRRAAREQGFTLIEVLVTIALAMVVFGATLTALDVFQTNNQNDLRRNEAQDNARNAIDRLARDMRNVAAPKSVVELPGALERAEPYSIVFQTIDARAPEASSENATNAMRVRYCLNDTEPANEKLWRQEMRWTSKEAPEVPGESTEATCPGKETGSGWKGNSVLASFVTNRIGGQNRALFTYGPKGWSETAQITTVEPTLYLDVLPGKRPGETRLTSTISLRNANRQPTASFTITEVNGHLLLNASASTDPDGLALSYKWSEGSKEGEVVLSSTAQQYETPLLISKSTHTFWLKVSDPGGLSASTKEVFTLK
jgi:prepilin-type N-terminal cleavage/methylation domain-containing protein